MNEQQQAVAWDAQTVHFFVHHWNSLFLHIYDVIILSLSRLINLEGRKRENEG